MKYLYLLVNFFTVIVPFIFSFHPRLKFYKHWKPFFTANFLVAALFTAWDIYFTQSGVWQFNPRYITGIYFINLPLEELLFFICIPYSCLFTYHCLTKFYKIEWRKDVEDIFCFLLSLCLFVAGIYFYEKLYTSVTFISTAFVLAILKYVFKIDWLAKLVTIYSVLLIPFLIVNGILTGTGPEEPVVIYNNAETLGIRILTIPFEDVFYGFELIMLNVFFYNYFKNRFLTKNTLRAVK